MAKYIDADAFVLKTAIEIAFEKARKATDIGYHVLLDGILGLTQKSLDEMPAADVVEVVRCKDCKFYKGRSCLNEELPICGDDMTEFIPDDNFYCAYAERRKSE